MKTASKRQNQLCDTGMICEGLTMVMLLTRPSKPPSRREKHAAKNRRTFTEQTTTGPTGQTNSHDMGSSLYPLQPSSSMDVLRVDLQNLPRLARALGKHELQSLRGSVSK